MAIADALMAARLCARDPGGLGGMVLRGGDGEDVLAALRAALPAGAPWRRLPASIDDEQLIGGLDLAATLARGEAVSRAGLLAAAHGGAVIVPFAERLREAVAAHLATVLDVGEVAIERDGIAARDPACIVLVLLDEGGEDDPPLPATLTERLAFHVDLRHARADAGDPGQGVASASAAADHEETVTVLAATAAAFGIESMRAPLFALRAARGVAALAGHPEATAEDVALAARLVLAPRAMRLPGPEEEASPPADPLPDETLVQDERGTGETLGDRVVAATRAALPPDVLARIADGAARRPASTRGRGAGERRRSPERGRRLAARAGLPRGGARLSLIDTLRAAAPWQRLRRRPEDAPGRLRLRRDDLRVRRFETRAGATTIVAVDASGSSAAARLAEAKGAVELLLADAYTKRAQVALIAFRGDAAELLLPATRSLARARRALADLPGGGGTPLAAGLDAARIAASAARAKGRTPFVVVLTDGRANVAADGGTDRAAAERDAQAAARAIAGEAIAAVFIDTSARPRPEGARLAAAMRARYLPLPRAGAAEVHAAVRAAQPRDARR